ncbi:MAG TPA: hypothetical protein ENJ82_06780, partial [Bacteroidetes bacterium]|nr:hypothetical protein [Bacteroidota bacterium]
MNNDKYHFLSKHRLPLEMLGYAYVCPNNMVRFAAYSLVFLYCAAMLRPVAPFLAYAVQYDYISKVLCINQDKPEMHCNGACHLKKSIAESSQKTQPGTPSFILASDYPIGFAEKMPKLWEFIASQKVFP